MILGYILNGLIIDKIGRKKTLLLLSIPQISACISIFLARNWIVLCISRIIIGIGYGGGLCATNTYLSEIGNQNNRGIFLALIKLSLNVGMLFVLLLGAYFTYNQMNFILIFLPLIFIVSFSFMPDSSHFLERERKRLASTLGEEEVKKSIEFEMKLMKKKEEVILMNREGEMKKSVKNKDEDMRLMENRMEEIDIKSNTKEIEKKKNEGRLQKLFTNKNDQKALIIVSLIFGTEVLSGHPAVMSFTQEIFDYSEYSLPAEYATLVLASMKIIFSFFSTQIVERVDRKMLFLGCGILATIAQGTVGIFFFLKYNMKMNVSSFSSIPLVGITIYEVVSNTGIGSMGFVYSGELFSPEVKGVGITLTNTVYDSVAFLVKLQFRVILGAVGISGTFFLFAISCAIGTGIVFQMAPETRGKSLEEIQEFMNFQKGKSEVKSFSS